MTGDDNIGPSDRSQMRAPRAVVHRSLVSLMFVAAYCGQFAIDIGLQVLMRRLCTAPEGAMWDAGVKFPKGL
jgi:hypothetical protein